MTDRMAETLTSLRDDHKQHTRRRILDSAAELICEDGEDVVTMASVAKRAGISERTVYRHFKNRGTLILAVWERLQKRIGSTAIPRNANEVIDAPLTSFPRYDDEQELLRAYLDSRRRRTLPASSLERCRQGFLKCVQEQLPGLDERQIRHRAAVAELLTSADAWDRMGRLWGFDGIEAGQAAVEALEVLLGQYPADGLA